MNEDISPEAREAAELAVMTAWERFHQGYDLTAVLIEEVARALDAQTKELARLREEGHKLCDQLNASNVERNTLRAENERLKEDVENRQRIIDANMNDADASDRELRARIATLEQQARETEKDKARLDWLGQSVPTEINGVTCHHFVNYHSVMSLEELPLRQAIDAATAATNKGGSEG